MSTAFDTRILSATSAKVARVQGLRASGATRWNDSSRQGTRRNQIASALAEWGYSLDDVLNGSVREDA